MKTETVILRECCDFLHKRGYFFWRQNNVPVFGRALPKYTPKGLSDIIIVIAGRIVAVEVKRPFGSEEQREKNGRKVRGGLLRPEQAEWAAKLALAGGDYIVVRSPEELAEELKVVEQKFL